jgi:hypothetical protein
MGGAIRCRELEQAMSYSEQLRNIANSYFADHDGSATSRDIARWAIKTGLWAPQPGSVIDQCAEELSRAMREEYYTDPQGREVRAKHAARIKENGKQITLWADIRSATPAHMERAFGQRRKQILGDCKQLKADVDSFNDNRNPENPIQVVFDFTLDLAEIEAAKHAA